MFRLVRRGLRRSGVALGTVGLMLLLWQLTPFIGDATPFLIALVGALLLTWYGGLTLGLLATLGSALLIGYFFLPPLHTFAGPEKLVRLVTFIGAAWFVGSLLEARRRAETALRASEERFRAAFERAAIGIKQVSLDGRLLEVNPKLCEILGYTREELLQREFAELVHPVDLRAEQEQLSRLLAGKAPSYTIEKRYLRRDGEPIWVRVTSSLTGKAGKPGSYRITIVEDISERRRVQTALEESEARLAAIVRSAMDAILTVDQEQRIRLFNAAAEQMFHCTAEVAIGQPIDRFIPERFRGVQQHHVRSFSRSGETGRSMTSPGDLVARRADGEVFPIEATISQVAVGEATLFTVIVRDITDRKRSEEALRHQSEELLRADRAKDLFLAMLGHELRTPLSTLTLNLQMLQPHVAPDPPLARLHARMGRQVERIGRLVDDLQDVTRIVRGRLPLRRELLDLVALARETAEDQRSGLEEMGRILRVQLPAEPALICGDRTRLAQVLLNLLNNAAKFTDAGGQVALEMSRNGEAVTLTVRDSGIGVEPEMLPHLFESWTQAESSLDRSRGGLGLGLALVKGIVELHGGQVWAASQGPGRGAEFAVRLPLAEVPTRGVPERAAASAGEEYERGNAEKSKLHPDRGR